MKFDIKDVKSWANRHDVKTGDSGYVSSDINTLQDDLGYKKYILLTLFSTSFS